MDLRRRLLQCACFGFGMAVVVAALHGLDAMPWFAWVRPKAVHWQRRAADYDTLVVGSSRLHYGFVPAVFDAAMAAAGRPSSTFDLACTGMRMLDYLEFADWALDQRPGLRRLIVELGDPTALPPRREWMTERTLQTHGVGSFYVRLRAAFSAPVSDQPVALAHLLAHGAAHELRLGQASRILDDCVQRWRGEPLADEAPVPDAGALDIGTNSWPAIEEARAALLADAQAVLAEVADKRTARSAAWRRADHDLTACRRLQERCRDQGVDLWFVLPPSLAPSVVGEAALAELGASANVLDFDDPARHPEFHALATFHDHTHLTAEGARAFTAALAAQLLDRLAAQDRGAPR